MTHTEHTQTLLDGATSSECSRLLLALAAGLDGAPRALSDALRAACEELEDTDTLAVFDGEVARALCEAAWSTRPHLARLRRMSALAIAAQRDTLVDFEEPGESWLEYARRALEAEDVHCVARWALDARLASTLGDDAGAERALSEAVVLDPLFAWLAPDDELRPPGLDHFEPSVAVSALGHETSNAALRSLLEAARIQSPSPDALREYEATQDAGAPDERVALAALWAQAVVDADADARAASSALRASAEAAVERVEDPLVAALLTLALRPLAGDAAVDDTVRMCAATLLDAGVDELTEQEVRAVVDAVRSTLLGQRGGVAALLYQTWYEPQIDPSSGFLIARGALGPLRALALMLAISGACAPATAFADHTGVPDVVTTQQDPSGGQDDDGEQDAESGPQTPSSGGSHRAFGGSSHRGFGGGGAHRTFGS